MKFWQTSKRQLSLERTLVMAILNVTPDSFSDGGRSLSIEDAISNAEKMVAEGADILDIGGESTRPGSRAVSAEEEIKRVVPLIDAITKRIDIPISIDTNKSAVARQAIAAGAEIINDISGLRFDPQIAEVAAETRSGLVLMHSRGTFETMHTEPPVDDIMREVTRGLHESVGKTLDAGVAEEQIAVDVGIGFGKTFEQNLELLANLDKLGVEFSRFPMMVGTSRKTFIGKLLGGVETDKRLNGSLASAMVAIWNGAKIVRVHDVKETIEAIRVVEAIRGEKNL